METKKRSLVKVFTWRLLGLIFWPTISYAITGDWIETSWLTGAFVFMTVMYYIHERVWYKSKFGIKK